MSNVTTLGGTGRSAPVTDLTAPVVDPARPQVGEARERFDAHFERALGIDDRPASGATRASRTIGDSDGRTARGRSDDRSEALAERGPALQEERRQLRRGEPDSPVDRGIDASRATDATDATDAADAADATDATDAADATDAETAAESKSNSSTVPVDLTALTVPLAAPVSAEARPDVASPSLSPVATTEAEVGPTAEITATSEITRPPGIAGVIGIDDAMASTAALAPAPAPATGSTTGPAAPPVVTGTAGDPTVSAIGIASETPSSTADSPLAQLATDQDGAAAPTAAPAAAPTAAPDNVETAAPRADAAAPSEALVSQAGAAPVTDGSPPVNGTDHRATTTIVPAARALQARAQAAGDPGVAASPTAAANAATASAVVTAAAAGGDTEADTTSTSGSTISPNSGQGAAVTPRSVTADFGAVAEQVDAARLGNTGAAIETRPARGGDLLRSPGLDRMSIDLSDEGLGPLTLQAANGIGGLQLRLTAGDRAVGDALAASAHELRRELEASGTTLGSLDVGHRDTPNRDGRARQDSSTGVARVRADAGAARVLSATASTRPVVTATSGLDLLI